MKELDAWQKLVLSDVLSRRLPHLAASVAPGGIDGSDVETVRGALASELVEYGFLSGSDYVPNPYGILLESLIDAVGME
ncbi:MAG TPA: hypothetical protein VM328_03940 [Fimbriimonadaceae bacterium]|jgi:hypothetical protein|nr:hypothetical protein [Fimbriimonadaceae bacterium]